VAGPSNAGELSNRPDLDRDFLHQLNCLPNPRYWSLEYGGWFWLCRRWLFTSHPLALINTNLDFDSFVKQYNKLEYQNLLHLGPATIDAFVPKLFQELGIFHRVENKEELVYLADSMHLNRFDKNLHLLGNKFTNEGFSLFNNVLEIVHQFFRCIGFMYYR